MSKNGELPTFKNVSAVETAHYIADMILELRNLAKSTHMQALKDLLELSYYEAFAIANPAKIPDGELEHLRELSKASKSV